MSLDQHDDRFEEQLPAALGVAADEFPLPGPDLVRRATARGRRLRRIRIAQVGATAVALTVVAVTGTVIGTGALGGGSNGTPQAVGPATQPHSTTGPATRPVGSAVSDQDMIDTLKSLLPPGGTVSEASGRGTDSGDGTLSAQLTYRLGHGTSGIDISLSRLIPNIPRDQQGDGGCVPVEIHPYDVCTTGTLLDGSTLSTTKSFTYPNSNHGQRRWTAALTTKAGAQLFVEEFGGGGEKSSTSSAKPVLTTTQLDAIVTSPAWAKAIGSIPVPEPTPPSDENGGPSGAQMTAAITALLPKGGVLTDWDASTGLVEVVYNDGHGRNMIQVDAQENMGALLADHMGCADAHGYCEATTLADGTKVKVTKQPSEKGGSAVAWQVDTLHPDGRRVSVMEFNSYAQAGPVTRPRPALSLAQLQAIALSPKWIKQP